ncbi:hypothetical protein [Actinacidiphila sp. bgisy160]|uniref:hypothetical protein n=1 Tax=Actinacidiphila sp. bgisy160 TaxID=3413796 RepID=UPI003D70F67F
MDKAGAAPGQLPPQWYATCVGEARAASRAARLLRQVLQDRVRHLGEDHPWTARTRGEPARFPRPGRARRVSRG